MPLPAFLVAIPPFLLDIAPSIVGGLAGGLLTSGLQRKPTTLEKVDNYVDRFSKYANAAKIGVDIAERIFGSDADRKARDAGHISSKLEAEAKTAEHERDLKKVALEKAQLELEAMKNGDIPYLGSEVPPEAGLAGVPSRKRATAKKPTPQVRRTA